MNKKTISVLAIAGVLLAACGSDGDDDSQGAPTEAPSDAPATGAPAPATGAPAPGTEAPTPATEAPAPNVDREATLRALWHVPAVQFDPHMTKNALAEFPYHQQVYDRLLQLDDQLGLAPMLATGWSFSEDGAALELELREGVTFSDGTDFDAEAVKANLERAKTIPGSIFTADLAPIESIDVIDAAHVRLNLSGPGTTLPYKLAASAGFMASPAAFDENLAETPVGTGPFTLDRRNPTSVEYERRDGYWDARASNVKHLVIETITDDNARINAFETGDYDILHVQVAQIPDLQSLADSGDFEFHKYYPNLLALYLNISSPGLDDVRVRQALSLATDRESINEQLLSGTCLPTAQPFPEAMPGFQAALDEELEYDPDRARELLAEAGVEDLKIEVLLPSSSPSDQVAEVLQAQYAEIGVDVTLTKMAPPEARAAFNSGQGNATMFFLLGGADPSITIDSNYLGATSPGGAPPELKDLADAARDLELGSPERREAYEAVSSYLAEQPLHIIVCRNQATFMTRSDVHGADDMPNTQVSGGFDLRYLTKVGEG